MPLSYKPFRLDSSGDSKPVTNLTLAQSPLIVVGLSARILAQSAVKAGWHPITVDLFADSDSRELGDCIKIISSTLSFPKSSLLQAIRYVCRETTDIPLVYGSGVDTHADALNAISKFARVIGNSLETLRRINTPVEFFALLDSLSIPYPEIRMEKPIDSEDWLIKYPDSEGGKGVFLANEGNSELGNGYYQKRIDGPGLTALFLANSQHSEIIGFNTQWTRQVSNGARFVLAGIMSTVDLSRTQKQQIAGYIEKLVECASLQGLCSIDFVLEDGLCKVLEVNPRPSTSLTLYDADYPRGLLFEHVNAIDGQSLCNVIRQKQIRAIETIFASQSYTVPEKLSWPEWTADRPSSGCEISLDSPLCTITASGPNRLTVENQLTLRKNELQKWVTETWQYADI